MRNLSHGEIFQFILFRAKFAVWVSKFNVHNRCVYWNLFHGIQNVSNVYL